MKQLNYTPDLTGLTILKTEDEQFENFFYSGHPNFMIPDFCEEPADIWISYLDHIERLIGRGIYCDDGGEVISRKIMADGLTSCVYEAYGVMIDEDSEPVDLKLEIEGYVVGFDDEYHFAVTKVVGEDNYL